ncbi:MAG: cell division protein FtsB, partial [Xanthomonadales bacterium]|nr:cell division protein FtsB [Xanthomonadales bacterium]
MRALIAILVLVFILLQFKLWFGAGGFRDVARLEQRVTEQARRNEELMQLNNELEAEVDDLRVRLDAVEE